MCMNCGTSGFWPWTQHPVQVAPPPCKEEVIFLDGNPGFYPDHRSGIHTAAPVYQNNFPGGMGMGMGMLPGGYGMLPYPPAPYQQFPCQQLPYPPPPQPCYGAGFGYGQYGWPYTPSYYSPFCPSSWFTTYYPPISSSLTYSPFSSLYTAPAQAMMLPQPNCPATLTAQAAAAAAANAALAQTPNAPSYFVGAPTDYTTQQAIIAANFGMQPVAPSSLAPYKPSDGQQFWCKELDGGWTLRSYSEIALGDASPGHWERHAVSGYFFWVRQAV